LPEPGLPLVAAAGPERADFLAELLRPPRQPEEGALVVVREVLVLEDAGPGGT